MGAVSFFPATFGGGSREGVRQGQHPVQKTGITLGGFEEAFGLPGGSDTACSAG